MRPLGGGSSLTAGTLPAVCSSPGWGVSGPLPSLNPMGFPPWALLSQCRFDPRQAPKDLVELALILLLRTRGKAPSAALDERGRDRRRDHGEKAEPGQHHGRGDDSTTR